MIPTTYKNIRFWKKIIEHFYGCSSLKSEKVYGCEVLDTKFISLESIHPVL